MTKFEYPSDAEFIASLSTLLNASEVFTQMEAVETAYLATCEAEGVTYAAEAAPTAAMKVNTTRAATALELSDAKFAISKQLDAFIVNVLARLDNEPPADTRALAIRVSNLVHSRVARAAALLHTAERLTDVVSACITNSEATSAVKEELRRLSCDAGSLHCFLIYQGRDITGSPRKPNAKGSEWG